MEHEGHECKNQSHHVGLQHHPKGNSAEPSTTYWSKKIDGKEGIESSLEATTPEKKPQPPVSKRTATDATVLAHNKVLEVPQKYENIVDFFDQMINSIRLLGLRKKLTTFQNISSQLKVLTKRNFQYNHLAQIKYLFPEAIEFEKILIHDNASLCMVPALKISLSITSAEDPCVQGKSLYLVLREVFRSRLLNFISNNPEHNDIPEAVLPDHFNTCKQSEDASKGLRPTSIGGDYVPGTYLLSSSSSKRCPENLLISAAKPKSLHILSPASGLDTDKFENCSCSDGLFQAGKSTVKLPPSPKDDDKTHCFCETTPMKPMVSRSIQEILTPAPLTPSIPNSSGTEEKQETKIMPSVQSARRSLFYSPSKTGSTVGLNFCELECSGFSLFPTHNLTNIESALSRGEPVVMKSSDIEMRKCAADGVSSGAATQKMLASLPALFDTIRIIFQSLSSHTITKQELLHKILLHNFEIEEPSQAEELLHSIEKMAPDWISAKIASSGDLLYSIERKSDIESIRARLVSAL